MAPPCLPCKWSRILPFKKPFPTLLLPQSSFPACAVGPADATRETEAQAVQAGPPGSFRKRRQSLTPGPPAHPSKCGVPTLTRQVQAIVPSVAGIYKDRTGRNTVLGNKKARARIC